MALVAAILCSGAACHDPAGARAMQKQLGGPSWHWQWSVKADDQAIELRNRGADWFLRLRPNSGELEVVSGQTTREVPLSELAPGKHEPERYTDPLLFLSPLREKLLVPSDPTHEVQSLGKWLLMIRQNDFEDVGPGHGWFALRNEKLPFAIAAWGDSDGWLLSTDGRNVSVIYSTDWESYAKHGGWAHDKDGHVLEWLDGSAMEPADIRRGADGLEHRRPQ